ncbi:hypothetical protein ACOMHN_002135 [Nucella lapillus]
MSNVTSVLKAEIEEGAFAAKAKHASADEEGEEPDSSESGTVCADVPRTTVTPCCPQPADQNDDKKEVAEKAGKTNPSPPAFLEC